MAFLAILLQDRGHIFAVGDNSLILIRGQRDTGGEGEQENYAKSM